MRGAEYYYCFLLLLFCFLIFEAASSDLQKWEAIEASAEPKVQREEVLQLLERIKTDLSSAFEITVDPKVVASSKNSDFVSLEKSSSDKIKVLANSGVSAAWGIHHYLKYFCGCHFSWDTSRIGKSIVLSPHPESLLYSREPEGFLDDLNQLLLFLKMSNKRCHGYSKLETRKKIDAWKK